MGPDLHESHRGWGTSLVRPVSACKAENEEKRVFYVACSRANDLLFLTHTKNLISTRKTAEKVFLIASQLKKRNSEWDINESLEELAELAKSADAVVLGSAIQYLEKQSQTYLGQCKLIELKSDPKLISAKTIICDDELTPTQQRNIENNLKDKKVIDRTSLILDIFAQNAKTKEGRLQVELAQNEYLLPRLAGQWSH